MKQKPLLIRKLVQTDNHSFSIEWFDGTIQHFRLSDLQRRCSCAHCVDEVTGKKLLDDRTVRDDVRAIRLTSVGRYALKVQFTSGCSAGIYTFDVLRSIGRECSQEAMR